MTKGNFVPHEFTIRPAKETEAGFAGRMLFESFPRKATYILGLGDARRAKEALTKLFPLPEHRLSMTHAYIGIYQGRCVGMMIAFPGRQIGRLNWKFYRLILSQFGLKGKIALIKRSLPLVFFKETAWDEFFLSNIVVKGKMRGRGMGSRMLAFVEEQARQAGYHKVSIRLAIDNLDAKRFFQNHDYKTKAIDLESNQRVRALGPGYQRMVKEL